MSPTEYVRVYLLVQLLYFHWFRNDVLNLHILFHSARTIVVAKFWHEDLYCIQIVGVLYSVGGFPSGTYAVRTTCTQIRQEAQSSKYGSMGKMIKGNMLQLLREILFFLL